MNEQSYPDFVRLMSTAESVLHKLESLLDDKLIEARLASQPKPEGEPGEPLTWADPPTSCEDRYYITRRNKRAWAVYDRELKAGVDGECGVYPSLEQAERAKRLYEESEQWVEQDLRAATRHVGLNYGFTQADAAPPAPSGSTPNRTKGLTPSEAQRIYPECNCGGNPQDFEGPLPACPIHGVEQPAFPHLIFPHDLEPCDLCSHTFGDHTLGVPSKPAIRACSVMKCNCENFKRWTGAQSGTAAPPPQAPGGTGLGFSPTEPKLNRMDELETTHPENLAAMTMKIGELEEAIRFHLYVCPLPSANLRKAIGYKPGVGLVRPCSLPFASIEDAGGPDPSPFDSDWNGKCQCGHLHGEHGPSSSINFTAGACQWSEARTDTLSEKCSCKHFIHEGTASTAP